MQKLKRLWRENRWLSIGFLGAFVLTQFLLIRLSLSIVFWSYHRDEPPSAAMNLGYIAHSHRVSVWELKKSIGLGEYERERRPIKDIAEERGVAPEILLKEIEDALARLKTGRDK